MRTAKQFLTYVNGAPFQPRSPPASALGDDYFAGLAADLRDQARPPRAPGSRDAGFDVFRPPGTYFVTTDIRPLGDDDGLAFCRALPERCGVVAVPNVVFYDDKDAGRPLVRFAFCKRLEVHRRGRRPAEGAGATDEGRRRSSTTSCGRTRRRTSRASRR